MTSFIPTGMFPPIRTTLITRISGRSYLGCGKDLIDEVGGSLAILWNRQYLRRSLQHEWTAYSATSFASTVLIHPSLPLWSARFAKVPQESPPRVSKLGIGRMLFRPPPERSAKEHPAGGSLPNTSCQRPRLHPWSPPRDDVSHVSFLYMSSPNRRYVGTHTAL